MNLSVSPINISNKNINFGMAKFSKKGLERAASCSDIYAPLGCHREYNELERPEFYRKTNRFMLPPLAKFIKKELQQGNVQDVCDTIITCAKTNSRYANAMFIKQLIASEGVINDALSQLDWKAERSEGKERKEIESYADKIEESIAKSVENVIQDNWDNEFLDMEETIRLVDMAEPVLADGQYCVLIGAIERSDS